MNLFNLISFIGLFGLIAIAWALSTDRRRWNGRLVLWGTVLQLAFGALIFVVPAGRQALVALSDGVVKVLGAATAGTAFVFGPLAVPPGQDKSLGFILATQGLATIVFFAALMQILYYLRVMPWLIRQFARVFTRLMNVSGAEALCAASNIFVGIESSTTIRPYLARMTRSELCTVLTAGLATIASSILGLYVMMLHSHFPQIAGHLISASILSAPAALMMSKLLLPEDGEPATRGTVVDGLYEREGNVIEAAINGATAGGKLVMGVIVLLLAFVGLVALVNLGLDGISGALNRCSGTHFDLRLESLLAWAYYPFALLIGVPPADAMEVARLLGTRTILTEIPAYQQLDQLIASGALQHPRSAVIAAYALCGFSHIPSLAIFVGGVAALAPNQTSTLSRIALRSLLAATLACLMTAAVAGVFFHDGATLLRP